MTKLNVKKIPKEPNLRFPDFRGEWGEIKIKEILTERKEKSTIKNQFPVASVTNKGLVLQTEKFKKKNC